MIIALTSPTTMTDAPPNTPNRYGGLDGLRAIAVALVVVYHLFPAWILPAGFLGVDVFFVISGFLITTLLLRQRSHGGRIRLSDFWRRRARRLLPALAAVITVCATAAWAVGGDVLVRIGAQVLGAATFSYNWVAIADGSGYFSAVTPELFRNLWSLAVEEQFYVVWPLVLPVFLLLPRAWARASAATLLALASAAWMGVAISTSGDATRAYFGTDTHAFGILLGVALAFLLQRTLVAPPAWLDRPATRAAGVVVGTTAVGGIVLLAMLPAADGISTFPGVLLGASVLTVVAISVGVWQSSWFGRAIDIAPLRWIGDRSYGIYLWHWPVLVLLIATIDGPAADPVVPVWAGLLALGMTLVAAELSYRIIERPVRRYGFRGSLVRVGARLRSTPTRRWQAAAAIAASCAVILGTSAAIAAAPPMSSAEAAVEAGRLALLETPHPGPSAERASSPSPTPTPAVQGDEISAVGDSVMLASAPALLDRFPGIQVDAEVSRSMWAGASILQDLSSTGDLRPVVVVALGTNGPVDPSALDEVAATIGPDRNLVLVNAYAPRSWIPGVNDELERFAAAHVGVVVADWSGAIASHLDLLAGDEIHPGSAGGRVFADTVEEAIPRADRERRIARTSALQEALVGPRPAPPASLVRPAG